MQCIELPILMNLACVVVECFSPGHIRMARCIRLHVLPLFRCMTFQNEVL